MRRIEGIADIADGLDALSRLDPRLHHVIAAAGDVPLRLSEPGFASLVSIIVSQQVSRASADAIMGRLTTLVAPLDATCMLDAGEETLRIAGLSRPKQRTVLALARAVHNDGLDIAGLASLDAARATAELTALPGIGPWTAEVYLLFCAGHPDIFPAGDVALQSAVGHALGIDPRPPAKLLYGISEAWSPWRGVAARLFWSYYREMRGREAVPPMDPVPMRASPG